MEAEDLDTNPFFTLLRTTYREMYERVCRSPEETIILVPTTPSLDDTRNITQAHIEAHVLKASVVSGIFLNQVGQSVEIKDGMVQTDQGFTEARNCSVIQQESMYEWDNNFKILIIDIPLVGTYKNTTRNARRESFNAVETWINTAPQIESEIYVVIDHFRRTYVQVPGFEYETGKRIEKMCENASNALRNFHRITDPYQQSLLHYTVGRSIYAALHSFIFPHLTTALKEHEDRLSKKIDEFTVESLIDSLLKKDLWIAFKDDIKAHIKSLEELITPQEKLEKIVSLFDVIHKREVTGDDVIVLYTLGIRTGTVNNILAHVAHMDLFLQAAPKTMKKYHETQYAFSSFTAAVSYLLNSRSSTQQAVSMKSGNNGIMLPDDDFESEDELPRLSR